MKNTFTKLQLGHLVKIIAISILLTISVFFPVYAQTLDNATKEKLEVIARYAIASDDNTNNYLDALNYKKPAFISSVEWDAFPAIRKIETAYKAAELNGQGKEFIEAFSKLIANDYSSIRSEKKLAYHFSTTEVPKIKFQNPSLYTELEKIPVPGNIKSEILTVGKYINEGSLGSLQSVFTNYMNLDEQLMYEILTKSDNNITAFEQGLLRSKVPPPHEQKLTNMANDLQKNYRSLLEDQKLSEVAKNKSGKHISFSEKNIQPYEMKPAKKLANSSSPGKGLSLEETRTTFKSSYHKYNSYVKNSYKNVRPSFKSMRNYIKGFGGVIFGDSIKYIVNPALTELRWRPISNNNMEDFKKTGYLECYFNNVYKTYGPVLYEDAFAANAIVNDAGYKYGNGIGMVSIIDNSNITFSNDDRRFGVTLHPAISHLRLGWAFAVADAFASASSTFETVTINSRERQLYQTFYDEENSTWKITDKQLKIGMEGNHIKMGDIALTMWGFRGRDTIPINSRSFDQLLPTLCNSVEEFKRVNEFAKVLAIFRWAKKVNAKISNITTYNSFIHPPINIVVNKSKALDFYDIREDHDAFNNEKKYYFKLLQYNLKDTNVAYAHKIDSLLFWYTQISNGREKLWNEQISNSNKETDIEQYFNTEDSSGLIALDNISFQYNNKWIENNIKLVNRDSLKYYQTMYNQSKKYLAPFEANSQKRSELVKKIWEIAKKYNIQSIADLNKGIDALPSNVIHTIKGYSDKIEALDIAYEKLFDDPVTAGQYYDALQNLNTLQAFRYRNKITDMISFYTLLISEQKTIKDYYTE